MTTWTLRFHGGPLDGQTATHDGPPPVTFYVPSQAGHDVYHAYGGDGTNIDLGHIGAIPT